LSTDFRFYFWTVWFVFETVNPEGVSGFSTNFTEMYKKSFLVDKICGKYYNEHISIVPFLGGML